MLEYTVRESKRAKHVRLKMTVQEGLVVVVPHGFKKSQLPAILQHHTSWIAKAEKRVQSLRELEQSHSSAVTFPDRLNFRSVGEQWNISYQQNGNSRIKLTETSSSNLKLAGDVSDWPTCKAALRKWTARKAREQLVPWLRMLSEVVDLPFNEVSIRNQRTRWGSCSGRNNISLNLKLLFLPSRLVRYVLLHELCHTIHLHHSDKFWGFLAQYESGYQQLNLELRTARQYTPPWLTL